MIKQNHSRPWQPTRFIRVTFAIHLWSLLMLIVYPTYWQWVVGALIANHLAIMLIGLWPRSHWLGENWTTLPAAAIARNEIALTIDDGPDPVVTPQVLDILDKYRVKATFFCIGIKALKYPDLCREIVRRGHAIENHSQKHRHNFSLLGLAGFERELQTAQNTLSTITGQTPKFFRAPAGLRNPFLEPVLAKLGLRLVSWSVRAFDTRVSNVDNVKNKLLSGLQPGAILLLHDGNAARSADNIPVLIAVLPTVLTAAKILKLKFVTLRQADVQSIS
ncbi:polysaccharide deacetylase family protein [Methyloradius palustris]|nr:polysaccharide deacetylase family protein [Methyloradius palustris]